MRECQLKQYGKGCVNCMYKIAVMGDKDSIYGFAALGMSIFPVEEVEEARSTLNKLASGNFGIIYITESLAAKISEDIDNYRFESKPAIILIPGISGNTGAGMTDVNKSVEKAVGSNILK